MPRVPTYDAQRGLQAGKVTTEASAVRISNESFTEGIKAMGRFGETLADVGEKQYYLQAKNELSKANLQSMERMNQSMLNASQDPQSEGFLERRNKEIQSAREDIVKTIKNPLAKKQFQVEFDNDAIQLGYKYKVMHNHLIIDETLTNFDAERAGISQQYFEAGSIQEKEKLVGRVAERYEDLWKTGAMTKREAGREFTAWRQNLVEGEVRKKINGDIATKEKDSMVLQNLLNPPKGSIEAQIPLEKRETLINHSKTQIRGNRTTAKHQKDENIFNSKKTAIQEYINGEMTPEKIEDLVNDSVFSPEQGMKFLEKVLAPEYIEDTNQFVYNSIVESMYNDTTDDVTLMNNLLDAYLDKDLSREAFNDLLTELSPTYLSSIKSERRNDPKYRGISGAFKWFSSTDMELKTKNRMMSDLLKAAGNENVSEERVFELAKGILNNVIKEKHPEQIALEGVTNGTANEEGLEDYGEFESTAKPDKEVGKEGVTEMFDAKGVRYLIPNDRIEEAKAKGFR